LLICERCIHYKRNVKTIYKKYLKIEYTYLISIDSLNRISYLHRFRSCCLNRIILLLNIWRIGVGCFKSLIAIFFNVSSSFSTTLSQQQLRPNTVTSTQSIEWCTLFTLKTYCDDPFFFLKKNIYKWIFTVARLLVAQPT
jgi:hypothetical protein